MPAEQPEDGIGAHLGWAQQLKLATAFLTRLPVGFLHTASPQALAGSAWAFPVVGIGVGAAGGLIYLVGANMGLTTFLAAVLAVAAQTALTGALHDDGLADVADGLGGGSDRTRALEIMRDSRLGTYGALTLFLFTAARIGAIAALAVPEAVFVVLMASGAVSRTAVVALMANLRPARQDGLGATAGQPVRQTQYVAGAIAAAAAFIALSLGSGLVALAATAAAVGILAYLALQKIGGYTGDVLGAGQQVAEIAFLVAAVALA